MDTHLDFIPFLSLLDIHYTTNWNICQALFFLNHYKGVVVIEWRSDRYPADGGCTHFILYHQPLAIYKMCISVLLHQML